MFRKVDHKNMGRANHGWLNTHFHFSFANYYNPNNMNFGALRVINDDLVAPQTGFDMHPHRDMEIISYVVDGALTHEDSMGNRGTIERGHVQYMSAGTGVFHSEHNLEMKHYVYYKFGFYQIARTINQTMVSLNLIGASVKMNGFIWYLK